ncbi:hypothetical protein SUDANB145_07263 (plasmid) [Streptomyces sp. enrichment culture]|uniref:MucR family transcriptional regulator n=1 Tax=Streptomyces sp. enrichment culture TaxID=1795815 RepID=UPI003F54FBC5
MSRRPGAADEDGLITCLICGRRFRSLGPHLYRKHDTDAVAYRAAHGLPASAALMGSETRAALSSVRQEAMKDRPELVARMRAATPVVAELARRSAGRRAQTSRLPLVRQARRRGWDVSVRKSADVRAKARDEAARKAGYASWQEAIEATRALPSREAARRLGVGKNMVLRWRSFGPTE